ncbi:MAG: hypothetical protein HDS68_09650 [Bacteroidales bacterium]|nr:hypothetical protein [Bacteroidales bacterium]
MQNNNSPLYDRRQWLKALVAAVCGTAVAGRTLAAQAQMPEKVPVSESSPRKVSRISAREAVACTGCDACMPCGYGVDIPGNFRFYNEMLESGSIPDLASTDRTSPEFRKKAIGFLRKYDSAIPDRHQSQRCIKCFHCVSECRERIFIVNELAALTAITDELRDWECREI